jgi:hypothetical protein
VTMFPDGRSKALAIVLACVIAIVCFGTLYYVGDLSRFQRAEIAQESEAALRDLNAPEQLDELVKRYPSSGVLKLVALARRDAIEIEDAARGLLGQADPGELWKRMDKAASSRANLEALGRDLKAAEDNAASLEARYTALVKVVHDKMRRDATVLEGQTDRLTKFMAIVDAQHAGMKDAMAKISAARLDYLRAYENCVAVLAKEFDTIKVVNGQFIFSLQPQADSYNKAAATMASSAKRLSELDTQQAALRSSQFEAWKKLAGG